MKKEILSVISLFAGLLIGTSLVGCDNENVGDSIYIVAGDEKIYEGTVTEAEAKGLSETGNVLVRCSYCLDEYGTSGSIQVLIESVYLNAGDMRVGDVVYFKKGIISSSNPLQAALKVGIAEVGVYMRTVDVDDPRIVREK